MDVLTALSFTLSLVTGAGMLYIAIKKYPHETSETDSNAVKNYIEAIERTGKQLTEMQETQDKLRETQRRMQKEIDATKAELAEVKRENSDLKDWAERLVFQVKSFGGTPVPFNKPVKQQ